MNELSNSNSRRCLAFFVDVANPLVSLICDNLQNLKNQGLQKSQRLGSANWLMLRRLCSSC
jgi:hypothetical protein